MFRCRPTTSGRCGGSRQDPGAGGATSSRQSPSRSSPTHTCRIEKRVKHTFTGTHTPAYAFPLFTPECCDSKSVFLVSDHTANTEAADTDEKPCEVGNKVFWIWKTSLSLRLRHTYSAQHIIQPFHSMSCQTSIRTYDPSYVCIEACKCHKPVWLIAAIRALRLISSVLHLIKGAVWGYYAVYIFICLPCNLINVAGPQVTGTLITGLPRRHFAPSETAACSLSRSQLTEKRGEAMN